jgi:glycosyltransferase involved in cell wall biosynthesis
MEKFRLAVINTQPPHLYSGGVERRIIETTKRLQNQSDITVYSGTKAGFKRPTTINGVNFHPINSTDKLYPLDNWSFNRNLTKNISDISADVYEAHAVSGYKIPKALKKNQLYKPLIHTIHGVLADEYEQAKKSGYQTFSSRIANLIMKHLAKLEAETAKNATSIVTISKYSVEKIQQHYNVNPEKVQIVPNGVDAEVFKPSNDQEALKQQFNFGKGPLVLFVGNLIPRKGLFFLVDCAKRIAKQQPNIKFLIAGEGPLKSQLTKFIQEKSLSDNFNFLGKVDEKVLPLLYNCSDVFVLPSIQEGQGIVLLEAQASGKPVVAFDIGGVNEVVKNQETGLMVNLGDSDALAEALIRLIDDTSLRESMGACGRKFIESNFTWDICAKKMLEVYREVLAN